MSVPGGQADWVSDADRRRDLGISRAVSHAERVVNEWNARADAALFSFLIEQCGQSFLAEDFVRYATLRFGLPEPPDRRAFGGVIRRSARAGKIIRLEYRLDAYCSPKAVWCEARG